MLAGQAKQADRLPPATFWLVGPTWPTQLPLAPCPLQLAPPMCRTRTTGASSPSAPACGRGTRSCPCGALFFHVVDLLLAWLALMRCSVGYVWLALREVLSHHRLWLSLQAAGSAARLQPPISRWLAAAPAVPAGCLHPGSQPVLGPALCRFTGAAPTTTTRRAGPAPPTSICSTRCDGFQNAGPTQGVAR